MKNLTTAIVTIFTTSTFYISGSLQGGQAEAYAWSVVSASSVVVVLIAAASIFEAAEHGFRESFELALNAFSLFFLGFFNLLHVLSPDSADAEMAVRVAMLVVVAMVARAVFFSGEGKI